MKGKARFLRDTFDRREAAVKWGWLEMDWIKRMGCLYSLDEMIQAIWEKLRALGELENTVFVFTSDNGYNLGAHGLIHKMAPYDESIRVPLYISGPGFGKGKVIDKTVQLLDLASTFLDIAGLQIPEYMDGISILPETKQRADFKRDALLLQYKLPRFHESYNRDGVNELPQWVWDMYAKYQGFGEDIMPFRAIRTDNHLYVEYTEMASATSWQEVEQQESDNKAAAPGADKAASNQTVEYLDQIELYDIKQDPYEMNNLVASGQEWKPEHQELMKKLKSKLDVLSHCRGKECYNVMHDS